MDNLNKINQQPVPDEVEMASRVFLFGLPGFKKKVDSLSLKSAKRVLKALIEFPLNDEKEQLLAHQDEMVLFEQAMELMAAKTKMIEYAVSQKQEKEDKNEGTNTTT